ncbi:MAG: hypothetical protein DDT19_01694 [Syntrophomonadaceae bacterium]|nr:hypothetical protein [Bacillota bacterium]
MKLLKATYRNFKGLKDYTFEPRGHNATVWGDNATGKTTLYDGILWLLFGKDSQNKKDFDIKTLTPDGQPIHNLNHEVEAEFDINNKPLLLKKRLSEKWTRKRGTATDEFTGHTTEHFVHGVPVSAGEYASKIASICDEDTFKLLTSPTYFNTHLHWQQRREILLQVCGDVSDGDVIASSKELAELPGILSGRSIDDHRKIIAAQRKKINEELKKIPVRIDEAERGLPDVTGLDDKELNKERDSLCFNLNEKQAEISRIKCGGEIAEKTKQLREIEGELLDIKNQHRAGVDEQVEGKRRELDKLKTAIGLKDAQLKMTERSLKNDEESIKDYEAETEKLRQQWHEVNASELVFEQAETCPSCGQALPTEKLEEAREKAIAQFNQQKAELLEEINTKGKRCKANIETLRLTVEENCAKISELTDTINTEREMMDKLQNEITAITVTATDPADSAEYKQAFAAKQKLESRIADLQAGTRELLAIAQEEADSIREQIQAVDYKLQKIRMREQGESRIKELAAEEKKLAKEFERLEREIYLTEQFIRAKVNLLEGQINSKFKYARFKLFDININGGIEPTCETLYKGVPYSTGLNKGHQGVVGLDIISTLCEHYQFWPPIVYDNAEGVTKLPKMKNQMICLYVSERDKQLKVEVDGGKNTLSREEKQ